MTSQARRLFGPVFVGFGLLAATGTATAQAVSRCPLNIRRAGPRVERPDTAREGAIIAYLGGPVTVTCGDAVMTGDSAEWRQAREQALMIGNVRYRDTTRTLNAERLTFYGARDEIIAVNDVRLVRSSTGATLEGPRVSFTRTPFAGARTVATGRPRMTLPPGRGQAGGSEPTVVDADVAEFRGESEASAEGNIEMVRGDVRAKAERAQFSQDLGRAVLYEDAVISGDRFDLAGDSIVAGFEAGELRTIHSYERATASGERFELQAHQIRARLAGDDVEIIWAFGDGRSLAASASFILAGDSIEFAFAGGRADSISAIGSAAAEQVADSIALRGDELTEPALELDPGASWIAGDTVRAWFEPALPPVDVTESGGEDAQIRLLRAIGEARSFYATIRDSTRSAEPSRNYLMGSRIDIEFVLGEPSTLLGTDAIGVYLEPAEEGEGG